FAAQRGVLLVARLAGAHRLQVEALWTAGAARGAVLGGQARLPAFAGGLLGGHRHRPSLARLTPTAVQGLAALSVRPGTVAAPVTFRIEQQPRDVASASARPQRVVPTPRARDLRQLSGRLQGGAEHAAERIAL